MPSFDDVEDIFFDANDEIRTSIDAFSLDNDVTEKQESQKTEYELWTKELMSIQERRSRFLMEMGFYELMQSYSVCSQDNVDQMVHLSKDHLEVREVMRSNCQDLDSASSDLDIADSSNCIKDLDSGKKFIVHYMGEDGEMSMFKEIGSNKLMTLQEFQMLLGLSQSAHKTLREVSHKGVKTSFSSGEKKISLTWWRNFTKKRIFVGNCMHDVSVKHTKRPGSMRTKVHVHRKRYLELSALYMGQEIQAHKGLIRTMKFSPCGRYLASGGDDCVVRIWQVKEVRNCCACKTSEGSFRLSDKVEGSKFIHKKCSQVVIPERAIKIEDTPLHELQGHTSDILDISWSNSGCLLTSSKDKTVRLWKVGFTDCLKVFQHNNYVTCVQFNPVDDAHFISGSIDGKVRVWGVTDERVVDWVDTRDIITAICYKPDGKGFIVGLIGGSCRFYDHSASGIQLDSELHISTKKKSSSKRITSLQFSPKDSNIMMATSANLKVHVFYGPDVIHKFKGHRRAKSQFSATFTSDGSHIISVGEDSNINIWNCDGSTKRLSKSAKSNQSCEFFFSEGASVAVPWPGMNQVESMLKDSNNQTLTLPRRLLEPNTTWLRDPDCFSVGARLFSDGSSRVSPTEDNFPCTANPSIKAEKRNGLESHLQCQLESSVPTAPMWSLVFVTASRNGAIRSFHNYGLPVRL